MDFTKKIYFSEQVFAQEVDGELVLLDMNTENYFGLDSVATDIWKLLSEGKSIQEVYDALSEMYDVEPDVLEKDIVEFITKLIDNKLATLS